MCGGDTKYLSFNHHIPRPSTAIHSHLTAGESDHGRNQRIPRPQKTLRVFTPWKGSMAGHSHVVNFIMAPYYKPHIHIFGSGDRHLLSPKKCRIIRPFGQVVGFLHFSFGSGPQFFDPIPRASGNVTSTNHHQLLWP